ncbi:MAG: tRNA pseudouridine(38-40) synthase TruA [Hyphomicrobiaceae bacterium]
MPRYRLTIEYDGTPFVGWQQQTNGVTVQGVLQDAFKTFTGEDVVVQGAGRTDSGVHARAQVGHCDLSKVWDPRRIIEAANFHLKDVPVSVLACDGVGDDFHARFSAKARNYTYRILNRRPPPTLDAERVWHVKPHLDVDAMQDATEVLIGHHDFTTFRATYCQARSPEKTLDHLSVDRHGTEVHVHASSLSFLHNQVRSMVGSLKLIGEGKWTKQDLANALAAKDRKACGPVAPAAGLYLMRVDY